MANGSDAELLEAYRRGDRQALATLVQRYEQPLFSFLLRTTGHRADAEDLFHGTIVRVITRIESYNERGRFGAWLFGIAHNLAVDRGRHRRRWRTESLDHDEPGASSAGIEPPDPSPSPSAELERKELAIMIGRAVDRLSLGQREVFLLRQHSDLTFAEIAELVGRPLNTVLGQMRLALLALRKSILDQGYEHTS